MKLISTTLSMICIASQAFAGDVVIKDVPEEAEGEVRRMAAVAVERHISRQLVAPVEVQERVSADIKAFKDANALIASEPVIEAPVEEPIKETLVEKEIISDTVNFESVKVIR